jgi:fatty acid synthase subunit alpha
MRQGNVVIRVETYDDRDVKVLEGTAEVSQPPATCFFVGQGPQEPGMGMELYNDAPAARVVRDAVPASIFSLFTVSLLSKSLRITRRRRQYTSMVSRVRKFAGGVRGNDVRYYGQGWRCPHAPSPWRYQCPHTFGHPNGPGPLSATQFTQIALVVTKGAAFEDMESKGCIQFGTMPSSPVISLGEYSALASVAGVLSISSLVGVTL